MPNVTAVLVSCYRPENVPAILEALGRQTERPDVILMNNGGMRTFGVDRTVHIHWNGGPWVRFMGAMYAQTEWVMTMDDDLAPKDAQFVADLYRAAQDRPDSITGVWGVRLADSPPYYTGGGEVDGGCNVIKGRVMMFRKALLGRVHLPVFSTVDVDWTMEDDIWFSLEVGGGQPVHWAISPWRSRFTELPDHDGICQRPGHYGERDRACLRYAEWRNAQNVVSAAQSVPGLCTESELLHLWQVALLAPKGERFVELGCFQGASTSVLWRAAQKQGAELTTIDNFKHSTAVYGGTSVAKLTENLRHMGCSPLPRIVMGESSEVPDGVDRVGCLFIDTEHTPRQLQAELTAWTPLLVPGAVVAFHDYGWIGRFPGMTETIDAWAAAHGCTGLGKEGHMVSFRMP